MARYVASVESPWPRERAFDYLAAFDGIAEWDPNVARAEALTEDRLAVGARFEVVSKFMGREVPLVYETIEIDRPRRVLLRAETGSIVSLDEMSFIVRPGGGTIAVYDAKLALKGPLRVLGPFMKLALRRLGDAARDGLSKRIGGAETLS
jgi:hypothetical protein